MPATDFNRDSFKCRLLAVLDYDCIPKNKRVSHLANACGLSLSTARRMLIGMYDIGKAEASMMFILADALKVHWRWIYDGLFQQFDARTARIQLVMIDGEPAYIADSIIESVCSPIPGEPDHVPLESMDLGQVLLFEQHRRMTPWEKNKNLRFMIRLSNNDAKAIRWLGMYAKGQLSRQQIFQMA